MAEGVIAKSIMRNGRNNTKNYLIMGEEEK